MPLKELKKIQGNAPLPSHSEVNLTVLGTVKLPVKSKSNVDQELTFHVVETISIRIGFSILTKLAPNVKVP